MLVGSDNGAVDHGALIVGITGKMLEQSLPNPALAPTAEPPVGVLPIAETFRQVAPRDSRAVSIEDRLDEPAIVARRDTDISDFPRKQVFDPLPLIVTQSQSDHGSAFV
jgi:hypothetical protein